MKHTFLVFVIGLSLYVGSNAENDSAINCIYSDNFASCQDRELHFEENVLFGGKCPGCVKKAVKNEDCLGNEDCAPGLMCQNLTCQDDKNQLCFEARRQAANLKSPWMPECLPDGTYAPKQCKGELMSGRCFCSNPDGERIFGEENWRLAENMTCACSRMMWEELKKRPDASLHCDDQGNFEELQCDLGVCWCAHQFTGRPFSIMVPQKMYTSLPCYLKSQHGDQYLRQCDSERIAQVAAKKMLSIHGTNNITLTPVNCNYDGSYARVQVISNRQKCVLKDKMILDGFEANMDEKNVNCNCGYDKYRAEGDFNFICSVNGNYEKMQYAGSNTYCVDTDGFPTTCNTKKQKINKN